MVSGAENLTGQRRIITLLIVALAASLALAIVILPDLSLGLGSLPSSMLVFLAVVGIAAACILFSLGPEAILYVFIIAISLDGFQFAGFSIADGLFLVLVARWLADVLLGKRKIVINTLYIPLLIFAQIALLSLLTALDLTVSTRTTISIWMMAALVFLVVNVCRTEKALTNVVNSILIAGGIAAIGGLFQLFVFYLFKIGLLDTWKYVQRFPVVGRLLRVTGFYFDPNYLALYLIPAITIGAILGLSNHFPARRRILVISCALLSLIVLFLTFSRGGWLTFLLLLAYLLYRRNRRLALLIWPIVAIIGVLSFSPTVAFIRSVNLGSFYQRLNITLSAIDIIKHHPLTGIGLGQLFKINWLPGHFQIVKAAPGGQVISPSDLVTAHNTFLQVAVGAGLLGFLVFLWMLLAVIRKGLSTAGRTGDREMAVILQTLVVALVLTSFCSLFLSALIMKQLWLLIGVTIAGIGICQRHGIERPDA